MDINEIVLELFSRVQVLEKKVALLEGKENGIEKKTVDIMKGRPPFPSTEISDKYKELTIYLYEKWEKKIQLTYEEIEDMIGFPLPKTAYSFPQSFWANTKTHSYAKGSWLALGYKAKVIGEKKILFERSVY